MSNMEETPRQRAAFLFYATMTKRNLRKFAKEFGVSISTAGVWSRELNWQERARKFDFDTAEQLQNIVIGDWVEVKAYLLRVLMKQVIDGVDAGIKPKSTGEMVAAIREIRSMMGDVAEDEDRRVEIVYTRTVTDGETGAGNEGL